MNNNNNNNNNNTSTSSNNNSSSSSDLGTRNFIALMGQFRNRCQELQYINKSLAQRIDYLKNEHVTKSAALRQLDATEAALRLRLQEAAAAASSAKLLAADAQGRANKARLEEPVLLRIAKEELEIAEKEKTKWEEGLNVKLKRVTAAWLGEKVFSGNDNNNLDDDDVPPCVSSSSSNENNKNDEDDNVENNVAVDQDDASPSNKRHNNINKKKSSSLAVLQQQLEEKKKQVQQSSVNLQKLHEQKREAAAKYETSLLLSNQLESELKQQELILSHLVQKTEEAKMKLSILENNNNNNKNNNQNQNQNLSSSSAASSSSNQNNQKEILLQHLRKQIEETNLNFQRNKVLPLQREIESLEEKLHLTQEAIHQNVHIFLAGKQRDIDVLNKRKQLCLCATCYSLLVDDDHQDHQ